MCPPSPMFLLRCARTSRRVEEATCQASVWLSAEKRENKLGSRLYARLEPRVLALDGDDELDFARALLLLEITGLLAHELLKGFKRKPVRVFSCLLLRMAEGRIEVFLFFFHPLAENFAILRIHLSQIAVAEALGKIHLRAPVAVALHGDIDTPLEFRGRPLLPPAKILFVLDLQLADVLLQLVHVFFGSLGHTMDVHLDAKGGYPNGQRARRQAVRNR